MKRNKVDIVTLGCSKNLVDSEQLLFQFKKNGYSIAHDSSKIDGEIVVVNTCGFIGDAQAESIEMILNLGEAKKKGKIRKLFVMGCLSERFSDDLKKEIPEVDGFYGKFNWKQLLSDLGTTYNPQCARERILTTPKHYAYLKIAEGCNRTCSYCAIPICTGRYQSIQMEELEKELRLLVKKGVKEFQVIAQDLTYYGYDLYKRAALPELIERLSDIEGVEWIRLHYAYPTNFPNDILRVMRERSNVCNYMDIALQHISDPMLKKMRRRITKEQTYDLIQRMREEVPGIHLRTTLMTGHPGETDADFEELVDFVRTARFERMGAFPYSHEEGTYAFKNYQDDVDEDLKHERHDELMAVQESIAAQTNAAKEGQTLKVIIDKEDEDFYVGRTEFDSPEVDPEVLIAKDRVLDIGSFYQVKIESSQTFDLYGRVTNL